MNQDGTRNGPANPAHAGSIVAMWGTGVEGLVNHNGGPDGGGVPAQSQIGNVSSQGLVSLFAGVGGYSSVPVVYAGGAPGLVGGIFQINAQVPQGFAPGALPIYLEASGIVSPIFTLYVAP